MENQAVVALEDRKTVQWLAAKTPEETQATMKQILSDACVKLEKQQSVNGHGHVVTRTALTLSEGACPKSALERAKNLLTPPSRTLIDQWLEQVMDATIREKRTDESTFNAYNLAAEVAAKYPADIVKEVLTPENWQFFPKPFELKQKLEEATQDRKNTIGLLELEVKKQEPKPQPEAWTERKKTPEALAAAKFLVEDFKRRAAIAQAEMEKRA